MLNGLSRINIELTNVCNKSCHMCGRRQIEKENPEYKYTKNIPIFLLQYIEEQLPNNILVQLHNDGEPTCYLYLEKALSIFNKKITSFNTNGKLLVEKADEIIDNVDTIAVSIFERDPEWEDQYNILVKFLEIKGDKKPNVIIRILGEISEEQRKKYEEIGCIISNRILHSPDGSFNYSKTPVVPEFGICYEMLEHPAIDVNGDVSICVRFDPEGKGILGNIKDNTLDEIWNGEKRLNWLKKHIEGKRSEVPLCSKCDFWGIPRG